MNTFINKIFLFISVIKTGSLLFFLSTTGLFNPLSKSGASGRKSKANYIYVASPLHLSEVVLYEIAFFGPYVRELFGSVRFVSSHKVGYLHEIAFFGPSVRVICFDLF